MSADPVSIIFFDGVCNLCNASVQRVLKNDTRGYFRFASLQSPFATRFLAEKGFTSKPDSIILYENGCFYTYATAVLRIAAKLRKPYPLLTVCYIVPVGLRNWVYRYIARNRYHWFGRRESCMIPEPGVQARFLDAR